MVQVFHLADLRWPHFRQKAGMLREGMQLFSPTSLPHRRVAPRVLTKCKDGHKRRAKTATEKLRQNAPIKIYNKIWIISELEMQLWNVCLNTKKVLQSNLRFFKSDARGNGAGNL